jgi:hypothetical protein
MERCLFLSLEIRIYRFLIDAWPALLCIKNQLGQLLPPVRIIINGQALTYLRSASSYIGLFQKRLLGSPALVSASSEGRRRECRTHWHASRSGSNHSPPLLLLSSAKQINLHSQPVVTSQWTSPSLDGQSI